jgi:hypothetical protein
MFKVVPSHPPSTLKPVKNLIVSQTKQEKETESNNNLPSVRDVQGGEGEGSR